MTQTLNTSTFRHVEINKSVDWSRYEDWSMDDLAAEHSRRGIFRRMGDGTVMLSKRLATDDAETGQ